MAGKRDVPATRRGSNVRREGEGPRGIRDRGARTWRSRGGSRLSEGARGERECPWGLGDKGARALGARSECSHTEGAGGVRRGSPRAGGSCCWSEVPKGARGERECPWGLRDKGARALLARGESSHTGGAGGVGRGSPWAGGCRRLRCRVSGTRR